MNSVVLYFATLFYCLSPSLARGPQELRRFISNANCDVNNFRIIVIGHDFINDESVQLFEFVDRRTSMPNDVGGSLPPDGVINDFTISLYGNTYWLGRDYYSSSNAAIVEIYDRSTNERLIRASLPDDLEPTFISCPKGVPRVAKTLTLLNNRAFGISSASCSGGIRVYGGSGRFYGEDYPLGSYGGVYVPEWDFPVRVTKADIPDEEMFINKPVGGGRHFWCAGSSWWQTSDALLFCNDDNCESSLGVFNPGFLEAIYSVDNIIRVRSLSDPTSPYFRVQSRRCIHSDVGDPRVKAIECSKYTLSQNIVYFCESENIHNRGCAIWSRESSAAISVNNQGNLLWEHYSSSFGNPGSPHQRWLVHRDGQNVAFESLIRPGHCLSYGARAGHSIILRSCNPTSEIKDPLDYAFLAGAAPDQSTGIENDHIPNDSILPELSFHRHDGYEIEKQVSYNEFLDQPLDEEFMNQDMTIKYCSGRLYVWTENYEQLHVDTSGLSGSEISIDRSCKYIRFDASQQAAIIYYVAFGEPFVFGGEAGSVTRNGNGATFFDGNGNRLDYDGDEINYTNLPGAWEGGRAKALLLCGQRQGSLFLLTNRGVLNEGTFSLVEDGCQTFDLQSPGLPHGITWNTFAFRTFQRSF